jgi:hypothetical protein
MTGIVAAFNALSICVTSFPVGRCLPSERRIIIVVVLATWSIWHYANPIGNARWGVRAGMAALKRGMSADGQPTKWCLRAGR